LDWIHLFRTVSIVEMSQSRKISKRYLHWRVLRAVGIAGLVVVASLGIGVCGYHYIAGFGWVDAVLNASMILTGMGPIGELRNDASKLFASAYAMFSGLILVTANGIILAPVFTLVLHRFHVSQEDLQ